MKESVLQNGENEAVLRPQRIQLRIGLETAMNIGVASIYENFIFFSDRDGESLPPISLHRMCSICTYSSWLFKYSKRANFALNLSIMKPKG